MFGLTISLHRANVVERPEAVVVEVGLGDQGLPVRSQEAEVLHDIRQLPAVEGRGSCGRP